MLVCQIGLKNIRITITILHKFKHNFMVVAISIRKPLSCEIDQNLARFLQNDLQPLIDYSKNEIQQSLQD